MYTSAESKEPGPEHPLSIELTTLKRQLRQTQRRERATERYTFYNSIMESEGTANFYRLINRNSKGSRSTVALVEKGKRLTDPQEQCRGFASYYEDLAIPKDSSSFDDDYKSCVSADLHLIRQVAGDSSEAVPLIEADEVERAIKKLHRKKAADEYGLVSEHLKTAGSSVFDPLALIFSEILQMKHIPEQFKSGILHPIHKKGKDASFFTNYRGITVTSLIGKVFEHVILEKVESCLPTAQSSLQFGFSKGLSPLMAALVISETIVESYETNQALYLSFLDTQKAFDVVFHESLKCKLFHQGINLHIWKVVDQLYSSLTSKVFWCGTLSEDFPVLQGVRQGGILSTGLYKLYINELLLLFEDSKIGTSIGTVYTGCPTVADDLTLSSNDEYDTQSMLDIAYSYANRERYVIHPEKSVIIKRILPRNHREKLTEWKLGDMELSLSSNATHLGLTRSAVGETQVNIDDRISCARRTFYSLTSSGLHGTNGLSPAVCFRIYSLYVIPRLLYGLETFVLNKKNISQLENFHLSILRIIQSLPQRTARSISYLLLGARPIEAEIHLRCLSFLVNIIRSRNSTLNNIMDRQLCMKGYTSASWFIYVKNLLEKYDLPSVQSLQDNVPSKDKWKTTIHTAVNRYWNNILIEDCIGKSTVSRCGFASLGIGKQHIVWKTLDRNTHDVRRGAVKVRLLTGTYLVQSAVSKFNQYQVDPTCLLCRCSTEDYQHMILECSALLKYRKNYLCEIKSIIDSECGPDTWNKLTKEEILQLCVDCTVLVNSRVVDLKISAVNNIERTARLLCYSIHCGRAFLLNGLSIRKR